ncbi:MAG: glucose 1-dehydrogenase [Pseudomonadota bacterium]|nr:glucose 1-dehydrogenase [Pseudomonadota bacterium]
MSPAGDSGSVFAPDLLRGRTAFVTGASAGLGRHFAGVLAAHGASVVAGARRLSELAAVVREIEAAGGSAHAVALDVRDPSSIAKALDDALAHVMHIDILVNNAGVAITRSALRTLEEEWQRVLDTNLSGAFRMSAAIAPLMRDQQRNGVIINIASVLAQRVAKQVSAYVASKAALVKLTEALALEFAPYGIRVNAIAPGYVETDLNRDFLRSPDGEMMAKRIPMRRFGAPSDLDGALLLLTSPAGQYMTGTTITVDGGHTLAWL